MEPRINPIQWAAFFALLWTLLGATTCFAQPTLNQTRDEFQAKRHNVVNRVSKRDVLRVVGDTSCNTDTHSVLGGGESLMCRYPWARELFYFDADGGMFLQYVRASSLRQDVSHICKGQRQNMGTLYGEKPYQDRTEWVFEKVTYYFQYEGGGESCSWGVESNKLKKAK
jgi:hypothetical protein